jgi:DNA-binding CsgD family transcriptional regulator
MAQRLSIREDEILERVANGKSTKEIAAELTISQNTVNWHVGNVLAKLGASTRAEAVAVRLRDDADEHDGANDRGPLDPTEHISTIDVTRGATRTWRMRALALGAALLVVLLGGAPLVAARYAQPLQEPMATPTSPARSVAPNEIGDGAQSVPLRTAGPAGSAAPATAPAATAPAASAPPIRTSAVSAAPLPTIAAPTLPLPTLSIAPSALPTLPPVPRFPRVLP